MIPQLKISQDEAASMDDFDLCELVWDKVVSAAGAIEEAENKEDYEFRFATKLPEHWWIVYSAHEFEYAFMAGGLRSFLFSNDGENVAETLQALKSLGADEYLQPLRDGCSQEDENDYLSYEHRIEELMKERDPRSYAAGYIRSRLADYTGTS